MTLIDAGAAIDEPSDPNLRSDLRALARHLAPELEVYIGELLGLEAAYARLLEQHKRVSREREAAQLLAGERNAEAARLRGRLGELHPGEHIKARTDARMEGVGWLRVTSLGGMRYAVEHVPSTWVVARDA